MKKILVLLLAVLVIISGIFAACSKKDDDTTDNTKAVDLENSDLEFGVETDEDGNEVDVIYETDENGNTIAVEVDKDGNAVTDADGNKVTVKTTYKASNNNSNNSNNNNQDDEELEPNSQREHEVNPNTNVALTSDADTTSWDKNKIVVPKTSDSGKEVRFSDEDMIIIEEMLEVPYLYLANYENSDGVPISIATHTAVWMAEHQGSTRTTYPSSSVVLNLFRFYGQTVVNFKTLCNESAKDSKAPITYQSDNDTFVISEFTKAKQTVSITKIEDLGNDNFYKVTAKVSGCNKDSVIAIVQKNKLDTSLGFSIKALKWS